MREADGDRADSRIGERFINCPGRPSLERVGKFIPEHR
jgi:hypothetical protein